MSVRLLFALLIAVPPVLADEIELKNGAGFSGDIVAETDESVTLKLTQGGSLTFERSQVAKIVRGGFGQESASGADGPRRIERPTEDRLDATRPEETALRTQREPRGAAEAEPASIIHPDLKAALANANLAGRVLLVDFYGEWCPWCVKMDEALADLEVQAMLEERFLYHQLDVGRFERYGGSRRSYDVRGIPCLIAFSPEGEVIDRIDGYAPPEELREFLTRIAEGQSTEAFEVDDE